MTQTRVATGPPRTGDGSDDFEAFVTVHWPRLRQVAWLLTRDVDEAEDLLQSVLERTCASWARVRRGDPSAYVRRALVNGHVDRWRRRRLLDALPVPRPREERSAHARPEEVVSDRSELVGLLGRLTARERAVVVLRHYCDLSTAEVADELGVSLGTVKSTLSRALATLRVEPDGPDGPDGPDHPGRPDHPDHRTEGDARAHHR